MFFRFDSMSQTGEWFANFEYIGWPLPIAHCPFTPSRNADNVNDIRVYAVRKMKGMPIAWLRSKRLLREIEYFFIRKSSYALIRFIWRYATNPTHARRHDQMIAPSLTFTSTHLNSTFVSCAASQCQRFSHIIKCGAALSFANRGEKIPRLLINKTPTKRSSGLIFSFVLFVKI